jgi:hypothetical protein
MPQKKLHLYRVVLKVRPAVSHPLFMEIQFGYLGVWILATDPDTAERHALAVTSVLPYEVVGKGAEVVRMDKAENPTDATRITIARGTGILLELHACPTGVDEGEFNEPFKPQDGDEPWR